MNQAQLLKLKKSAHHLKPVILIGQKGLTEAVIAEIEQALEAHELIKIKMSGWEKDDKLTMLNTICHQTQADLIQNIGHTTTIYRKNHAG